MRRSLLASTWMLMAALAIGFAQEPAAESALPEAQPAATTTEAECSGFIADESIPKQIVVFNGEDNDHFEPDRQFSTGDMVYLRFGDAKLAVGEEYRLVRRAKEQFRTSYYTGQHWYTIRKLGRMYQDTGRVKVARLTENGAVAEVTFSCGPIHAGDVAVPYQPRVIPSYVPTTKWDRYASANGKLVGQIVAAHADSAILGKGTIAYLDIGEEMGVRPGQRYRIFRTFKDRRSVMPYRKTPRETTGELIILSCQRKSSVGIVVNSSRELALRDGVELE